MPRFEIYYTLEDFFIKVVVFIMLYRGIINSCISSYSYSYKL